jgi:hypothetical protein
MGEIGCSEQIEATVRPETVQLPTAHGACLLAPRARTCPHQINITKGRSLQPLLPGSWRNLAWRSFQ